MAVTRNPPRRSPRNTVRPLMTAEGFLGLKITACSFGVIGLMSSMTTGVFVVTSLTTCGVPGAGGLGAVSATGGGTWRVGRSQSPEPGLGWRWRALPEAARRADVTFP